MTHERCTVLVVDSDAEVRNVIDDLLFDQGFEVRLGATVEEALQELRGSRFDVLLCHLPLLRTEDEGFCHRLRELRPKSRVVAMSASGAQARGDEADASISKPFTRSQLVAALRPS
ncbi:MAG: hypothetical protein CL908_21795 [Deltaproteobacteria bacterium]|nr:hypothetical protein [Deltaproteobacteria bacterium]